MHCAETNAINGSMKEVTKFLFRRLAVESA